MASPQIEDGYCKIANELLEAKAKIRISGEENQIWEVMLRKTYGYNKKTDKISIGQFALATGMNRGNIHRALRRLEDKKMTFHKATPEGIEYGIQKDFEKWNDLPQSNTRLQNSNTPKEPTFHKATPEEEKRDNNAIAEQASDLPQSNTPEERCCVVEGRSPSTKQPQKTIYTKDNSSSIADLPQSNTPEMEILKSIPGYPFDIKKDSTLLEELKKAFPDIDSVKEIHKLKIWLIDNPLKAKSKPRSRISNWFANAKKFQERDEKNGTHKTGQQYQPSATDWSKEPATLL